MASKRLGTTQIWRIVFVFALLILFIVWLVVGSVFYAYYNDWGLSGGFFYAAGIVSDVGFNYDDESDNSKAFSIVYMIFSIFTMNLIVLFFRRLHIFVGRKRWYDDYSRAKDKLRRETQPSFYENFVYSLTDSDVMFHYVLLVGVILIIIAGTAFFCDKMGENFVTGLYYTISVMTSTGIGFTDWDDYSNFQLTSIGFFALFAAIITKLYILQVDEVLFKLDDISASEVAMDMRVSTEEYRVIRDLGVGHESDRLSRQEYLILMLSRMGLFKYDLITHINDNYDKFNGIPVNLGSDDADGDVYGERLPLVFTSTGTRDKGSVKKRASSPAGRG